MATKSKIKTFEDALAYNGETIEQFNERTKSMSPDTVGYEKIKSIVLALNEGENVKRGYYPWFWKEEQGSGVGLSFYDGGYAYDCASVGARLLFKTSELATYAGQQFIREYDEHING